MSLIRLTIDRISYSQNTNGAYALLLSEKDGERKLPVVIGAFEAQSIAVALEKEIKPPRPLTHDLFKNFSDCFEIKMLFDMDHDGIWDDDIWITDFINKKGLIQRNITILRMEEANSIGGFTSRLFDGFDVYSLTDLEPEQLPKSMNFLKMIQQELPLLPMPRPQPPL